MVAGPDFTLKVIGRLLLAVGAVIAKGASPKALLPMLVKGAIVWAALLTVILSDDPKSPAVLVMLSATSYAPAFVGVPEINPVPVLMDSPSGRLLAANPVGLFVAVI